MLELSKVGGGRSGYKTGLRAAKRITIIEVVGYWGALNVKRRCIMDMKDTEKQEAFLHYIRK